METAKSRLLFLDTLRCIAALMVLFQHVFNRVSPAFRHFTTCYFQFGAFGVTLFFLISGFIIPVSLERSASLKKFWIHRVFRLYPLYLLSICISLLALHFGHFKFPSGKAILANLLMVHAFIGQPGILTMYWTLCLEMAFYLIISLIYLSGYIRHSTVIAIVALSISLCTGAFLQGYLHVIKNGWGTVFYLAVMFTGTLYYRYMHAQIKLNALMLTLLFALFVLLCNAFMILYGHDDPRFGGDKSFVPVTVSIISAYLVFSLIFYFRKLTFPAPVVFMGTISYSIYLLQGTVFLVFRQSNNGPLIAAFWILLTLGLSALTYHFVEKPAIEAGKKLS
jgi:peptidoglycan/LPS O-acetylase OafA/YrhL